VFLSPQQFHHRQPDSKQSQINFKLAAQASVHPPSSPCCEEELATLCSGGMVAQT